MEFLCVLLLITNVACIYFMMRAQSECFVKTVELAGKDASIGAWKDTTDKVRREANAAHAENKSLKTTIKRLNDQLDTSEASRLREELAYVRNEKEAIVKQAEETVNKLREECNKWCAQSARNEKEMLNAQYAHEQLMNEKLKLKRDHDDWAMTAARNHAETVAAREQVADLLKQNGELMARVNARDAGHDNWLNQRDKFRREINMLTVDRGNAVARVIALEEAIRKHRDARGHDRCLRNDHALYAAYDPNSAAIEPTDGLSLPVLMAGCTAYWMGQLGMADRVPDKMEVEKKDVMT